MLEGAITAVAALGNVERKAPLVIEQIDFQIGDRALLAERLSRPLAYAQRVEALVTGLGIETLVPRHGPVVRRFLRVWTDDEITHGHALALLLGELGLPHFEAAPSRLPPHNHIAKYLGQVSARVNQLVEFIWATQGAMNEHLAMCAYLRMGSIAQELGEHRLYETLFRRLRSHEAAHKSFYAAHGREVGETLLPWQRKLARAIVVKTYAPVGAGGNADRAAFGHTIVDLAGSDDWRDVLADPVQAVAERLLSDGEPLPPFVAGAIEKCLVATGS
jgi:hypothetical protein